MTRRDYTNASGYFCPTENTAIYLADRDPQQNPQQKPQRRRGVLTEQDIAQMWLVLREELINAPILHEFACLCAERALERIDKPDARSVAAIEAKRKWMRGEISDDVMDAARDAAMAASWAAAMAAAWTAEREWQVAELMRMLEDQE